MRRSLITSLILVSALFVAGCSSSAPETQPAPAPQIEVVQDINVTPDDTVAAEPESSDPEPDTTDLTSDEANAAPDDSKDAENEATEEDKQEAGSNPNAAPIVWLGDSLTQGSLGSNNDNLANAPYEKLKKMVSTSVEGVGLYGYKTNDIFWVYRDSSQMGNDIDPSKTYIFWVGSNDWVKDGVPNTDTAPVIEKIDTFLTAEGNVSNYIVIGTTARYELGDSYKIINKALSDHYKSHYLDVIDTIGGEYGPDKIHLTQKGYDAVAVAVYEKLKALGYI